MTFTNGVSTTPLSATLYAAGVNSVTATTTLPSVAGVDSITVAPAVPNKLAFTPATPGPGTAGSSIPNVAVSVEDTYGNVVTSASGGSVTPDHSVRSTSFGFTSGAAHGGRQWWCGDVPNLVLNTVG